MSDQFTETKTTGWGSRIANSVTGVLVGLLLFLGSFVVLYLNEGRDNLSEVAKTAIEISANTQSPIENNHILVSATASFQSNTKIGDAYLKADNYIGINRMAEMYAWEEIVESKSTSNTGGSETTETTYTYQKAWKSNPTESSKFKYKEGHKNPEMSVKHNFLRAPQATLGIYDLDLLQLNLPTYTTINLTSENVILQHGLQLSNSDYLFKGNGSLSEPEIGDIRVSYKGLRSPVQTATVFGKLDIENSKITPYYTDSNSKLYRVFQSNRDTAISTLTSEYKFEIWTVRALGLLLMWIGLVSIARPMSIFLDVVPTLGSLSKNMFSLILFVVALILSIITILVSMILHNLLALIVVVALAIFAMVQYSKQKGNNNSKT